jgi:hypothetical protein
MRKAIRRKGQQELMGFKAKGTEKETRLQA